MTSTASKHRPDPQRVKIRAVLAESIAGDLGDLYVDGMTIGEMHDAMVRDPRWIRAHAMAILTGSDAGDLGDLYVDGMTIHEAYDARGRDLRYVESELRKIYERIDAEGSAAVVRGDGGPSDDELFGELLAVIQSPEYQDRVDKEFHGR